MLFNTAYENYTCVNLKYNHNQGKENAILNIYISLATPLKSMKMNHKWHNYL